MDWNSISYPRALLVALLATLALTLVITAGTSSASLGAYNPSWDGTSGIRTTADATGVESIIAQNSTTYEETTAEGTVAVVLSPDRQYNERAAGRVTSFVRSGGTLVVAEDYGQHGNELLAAAGTEARINGTALRDEQQAGPSPAFPHATPTANHTYTENVSMIVLNHGSTVDSGNATTLMSSSEFSYHDTNGNERLDDSEILDRRPVVTIEPVGDGHVLVVSDPGIFLNSMLERGDNEAFLRGILGEHERVLLDMSHSTGVPPLVALQLALQQSGLLTFVAGSLSVMMLVFLAKPASLSARLRGWRKTTTDSPTPSSDELTAAIRARHPDWDDERVERVTNSLIRRRQ